MRWSEHRVTHDQALVDWIWEKSKVAISQDADYATAGMV